jgi:bifunctional DNase/RNase
MLETEIWSIAGADEGNIVLLRPLGSDMVVPIFIGQTEAHAILLGLGKEKIKRPLTCDTLLDLSRRLGLSLLRVEIYEIRNDVFYARLLFSGGEYSGQRPLIIECRPSDAIALAVREKCAVYLASQVLDHAGVSAEIFIEARKAGAMWKTPEAPPIGTPPGTPPGADSPAAERRRLQAELEQVVEQEDYERAAEIRDTLILLDQKLEQERGERPLK